MEVERSEKHFPFDGRRLKKRGKEDYKMATVIYRGGDKYYSAMGLGGNYNESHVSMSR